MLKTILTTINLTVFITVFAQDIVINSVNPDPVCAGSSMNVDYTCVSFTPTGTLSVELSDATGNFASPVVIATVASATSGSINAEIPDNTSSGTGYRVRITSSAPVFTGSDNGNGISINAITEPTLLTGTGPYCEGNSCVNLIANPTGGSFSGTGVAGTVFCPSSAGVGIHSICYTYTDVNGCSTSDCELFEVIETPISISISGTLEVSACGACDGSITAVPSGGTLPYTYFWSPILFETPTVQGLCAGPWNVLVTDANGCTATANATITEPPSTIEIGFNGINSPTMCGACDGSISAFATGGNAPYQWTMNNIPINPNMLNLCEGPYVITATDISGCSAVSSININEPDGPILVLDSIIHINCLENNSTGSIYVHAEGGSGGYSFILSLGGAIVSNSLPPYTNLQEGDYYVQAIDLNGCSSLFSGLHTITNTSNLYASTTATDANCDNNGTATATAQGQNPPYTYVWNDPLNQTTATAANLGPGEYSVQVTDAIGCIITGVAYVDTLCMNVIRGRVYMDINQNCIQDIGELAIANAIVQSNPGGYHASTNSLGEYMLLTPHTTNTVSLPNYNQFYATTCPPSGTLNVNFTQLGDTSYTNDFGYYADPSVFDLRITGYLSAARPGFTHTINVRYRNNSLFPQNATVRLVYDPILVFNSAANGGVHDAGQHTVEWSFPNLQPTTNYQSTNATFTVPVNTPIGAIVTAYMEILPIAGDLNPSNNTLTLTRPVTNSYDPNDKAVDPTGVGETGNILPTDTILFYTVRFQNTGNDTAFTVVVKDTLSQYLNPATIVPGSASHPYTFSLTGQGVLTFRFDQILLPDSNINEPLSHGYFNYTIHLKNDLPLGTVIENTAGIYFDFNEPIITNTTVNTIALPVSIHTNNATDMEVYPNPASTEINVRGYNPATLKLCNTLGQTVAQAINTNTLQIAELSKGLYLLQVFDKKRELVRVEKVVKE
jgi:uncharacterized repeat protein (TIGR01451 family)